MRDLEDIRQNDRSHGQLARLFGPAEHLTKQGECLLGVVGGACRDGGSVVVGDRPA